MSRRRFLVRTVFSQPVFWRLVLTVMVLLWTLHTLRTLGWLG